MSSRYIQVCTLCMLLMLYIISGARNVSAEMKGIPRSEEKQICSAVGAEKKQETKMIASNTDLVVENSPTLAPSIPPTAEKPASLSSDLLFEMINNHRATLGLNPYQKDDNLCKLAQERGPELYNEVFVSGDIHGGLYARNLPYWITENMKHGPDENDVFTWWMNSYIHKKAIEGDFLYSCGECYGNTCAQLFTSYVAK